MNDLTNIEMQEYFTGILEYGKDKLEGLPNLHLKQLLKYLNVLQSENLKICVDLMDRNPNYPYPGKYLDKELEYWMSRNSNYLNATYAIEVLQTFIDTKGEVQSMPITQTEAKKDKLKVPQIALIHVYEGRPITRANAGIIAAKHGYTAKTSGEGLFQDYTKYCSTANRKGKPTPCTSQKLKNKIELFESVVDRLSDNKKQRAIDEIKILKTIQEDEYQ